MKKRTLNELNLMDKFLFDEAVENVELMTMILEIILGHDIILKVVPQTEKELRDFVWSRQVRLDVLNIDSENNLYATEVQQKNTYNLPKRSRNYVAMIDRKQMMPGDADYNSMPDVYVIMIMPFDLFGMGRYKYTIKEYCEENKDIELKTGVTKIFLNTKGTDTEGVSEELIALLKYFQRTTREVAEKTGNEKILKMHDKIEAIRKDEEVGVKFVQRWEEELMWKKEGEEKGRSLGIREGEEKGRRANMLETASRMKSKGLSFDDIADITGLTLEEVEEIPTN